MSAPESTSPMTSTVTSPAVSTLASALRRKSRRYVLVMGAAALLSFSLLFWFLPIWSQVTRLAGGVFILAATGFGLALAIGPLGFIGCLLMAIFLRVEACTQPGESPRGAGDWLAVAGGVLFSFAPAGAVSYMPVKALLTGEVRYKFPAAMVQRVIDPLGYWQGVAYWSMGAAALAVLAVIYWRSRWQRRQRAA